MTAFVPANLPGNVNTIEKLHFWTTLVLVRLYPNTTIVESVGGASRIVDSQPFYITASDTPVWRQISRTSLALDPAWVGNGKPWQYIQDIGNTAIPADLTSP